MIKLYSLSKGTLRLLLTVLFIFSFSEANAQWGWGDEEQTDSTENDSMEDNPWGDDSDFGGDMWGGDDGGNDDKGTAPTPLVKYERVEITPVDTLTKLITYTAVHDVENECDYCTSDSLYYRVKQYLLTKYGNGKKLPKGWVMEDAPNQRIIMTVRLPLITRPNKFSENQVGEYEFKFQLWIRDYAYKYKFTHIVHYDPIVNGRPGDFTPVYLEYYMKNKTKVRFTDMILLAVDKDMKELIDDIVRVMKDPVTVDLDEEDF